MAMRRVVVGRLRDPAAVRASGRMVSGKSDGRIGCADVLSSAIHPVTTASSLLAFARTLASLSASHGPVNAHTSGG